MALVGMLRLWCTSLSVAIRIPSRERYRISATSLVSFGGTEERRLALLLALTVGFPSLFTRELLAMLFSSSGIYERDLSAEQHIP